MKRAFTLVELLVVIIILSVLATLGFQQYIRMVEKSRSSEAKMVLGHIRDVAFVYYTDNRTPGGFDNAFAGIGPDADQIPDTCRSTHYFSYDARVSGVGNVLITATRCTAGGKSPNSSAADTIQLIAGFAFGRDDLWRSDPVYR